MGGMKRRVVSRAVIPAAVLVISLVTAVGLFGPFAEAGEENTVVSTDDGLAEATFYVA